MARISVLSLSFLLVIAAARPAGAQQLQSEPQVNPDGAIAFRYENAAAAQVELRIDSLAKPLPMKRGEDGVWAVVTPVLPPQIYAYTFMVDGRSLLDPHNAEIRHNLAAPSDEVTVPAQPPAPWELTDIPHGVVSRHVFTTRVAKNLPHNQSAYLVYTPPGYDPKRAGGYPVLYLLHGYTDAEDAWINAGRADRLLDSMIDSGKAKPMIAVMPLGYGDFDFLKLGRAEWDIPERVDANVSLYDQMLETEVIPAVEHEYNVAPGREHRAIAGLSMGGLQSLTIGLNHPDQFAYVAAFSSALQLEGFDQRFPNLDAKTAGLRLLWVGCGVDDHLIAPNRDFFAWAKGKNLPLTEVETPGGHSWLVWRDNLLHVAPLLFR